MKNTNHDKNLDCIYDNHPEMLDDYIDVYENSILAVDHTVSPEDMIDIRSEEHTSELQSPQ